MIWATVSSVLGGPTRHGLVSLSATRLWSVWSEWLVVCDCGFSLSALWCPLSVCHLSAVLLGFLLRWTWGSSSATPAPCSHRLLQVVVWKTSGWDLPTKILLNFSSYLLSQLLYQVRNSTNLIAVPATELQQYPVLLAEREWFNPIFLSSYELSLLKDKLITHWAQEDLPSPVYINSVKNFTFLFQFLLSELLRIENLTVKVRGGKMQRCVPGRLACVKR